MKTASDKTDFPFRRSRLLILAFLLVSGSCGLIYEILWMKMLTLVIGNTVFAISTVLTAFMGGLALGSFLAGRLEDRITDPLRTYGILEGAIGAYALLLPLFIAGAEPLFRFIYQGFDPSFYAFSLIRFAVCGILLLVPTTLMGATLPILSKHFVEKQAHVGWNVGLLYGVNTFGAVLGSFAAGFVLIPTLGITWTIYLAALLNFLICAGMLKLAKNPAPQAPSAGRAKTGEQKREKANAPETIFQGWGAIQWVALAAIGVSGIAAMIYQVAWTKVLLLSIGSSVYAFSLIVTAFIAGLALGSLAIAKFIDRGKDLALLLALMQGAIGISALVLVPIFGKLPILLTEAVFSASNSFPCVHFAEFVVIFALMLVPTFMMGAAVPLAVKICTTDVKRVGRFFGNIYAINTLGAIVGAFVAGFIFIPWLGAQNSIFIAIGMNIVVAGLLFLWAPSLIWPQRLVGSVGAVAVAALLWSPISQWDAQVLSSGPYLYFNKYKDISTQEGTDIGFAMKARGQLLYSKEGLHALVSVEKTSQGDLLLGINGKIDASAKGGDVATQLMVGHLPLLLHPGAADVLLIGLGSGMTLGAVEKHPVKTVDVVEIEAAVVEASRFFTDFTGDVLDDPRVNLIVADGRNHVALTRRKYDVVISEPSNPWVAGMANLFTREFFDSAKKRLKKGGLMCQWVHAYSMSSLDFKTVVATFQAVFPHVTLWEASFGGDYLLIGSPRKVPIDPVRLRVRLAEKGLKADLGKMRTRSLAAFLSRVIMNEAAIPGFTEGAPLHTDGNARLEYSAPKALFQERSMEILDSLYAYRESPLLLLRRSQESVEIAPEMERDLAERFGAKTHVLAGFVHYTKGEAQAAVERFEHALALSPQDYDSTYLLAKLYYEIGNQFRSTKRLAEATRAYQESLNVIDDFIDGDRSLLGDHFSLDVICSRANFQLGTLALDANRMEQAAAALEKATSGEMRYAEAHSNLGIVYERTGRYDAAVAQYQRAIELNPGIATAYISMGNIRLKQKRYREAIESYLEAKKLRPDFALIHYNLGFAYFQQDRWAKAEKEWERALALKPGFSEAQKMLNAVRKKKPYL